VKILKQALTIVQTNVGGTSVLSLFACQKSKG